MEIMESIGFGCAWLQTEYRSSGGLPYFLIYAENLKTKYL
jgi:hypothetical protein